MSMGCLCQAYVSPAVLGELKRIVEDSEIMQEDDANWPEPDKVGRQELEILLNNEHISFTTGKIGSLADVNNCKVLLETVSCLYIIPARIPKAFVPSTISSKTSNVSSSLSLVSTSRLSPSERSSICLCIYAAINNSNFLTYYCINVRFIINKEYSNLTTSRIASNKENVHQGEKKSDRRLTI